MEPLQRTTPKLLGLHYFKKFDIDLRGVRLLQVVGLGVIFISKDIGQYSQRLIKSAVLG